MCRRYFARANAVQKSGNRHPGRGNVAELGTQPLAHRSAGALWHYHPRLDLGVAPCPLHLAYPFMGLAFLIVPGLGWLFLGEPIQLPTVIGGALILAGIAVAAQAA